METRHMLAAPPITMQSTASAAAAGPDDDGPALTGRIIDALRTVYDPEIPVNIYDLGLIYRIALHGQGAVEIDMTLTAPGCPVAGEMLKSAHVAVSEVASVSGVKVNLIFDPPWDKSKMSEDARLELGFD